MFVVMAFVTPTPGKADELADRMRSFREVIQTKPGLVKTALLSEQGGTALVGLSMWTDETSYEKAMASIQGPSPQRSAESLREAPPILRRFTEI